MSLAASLLALAGLAPGPGPCAVCGRGLSNSWLQDSLGRRFCPGHGDAPRCGECALPLTGPGELCPGCAERGPRDDAAAATALAEVQADLRGLGLPWWPQAFPVRLAGGPAMAAEGLPFAAGVTRRNATTLEGRTVGRRVECILLRAGQGHLRARAVLAHELGHAWLWQMGFLDLPPTLEEGFAELCAHRWLGRRSEPQARLQRQWLEENPDPLYGGGFRALAPWFRGEPGLGRARELVAAARAAAAP